MLLAVADGGLPRLLSGPGDVGRHGVDALDAFVGIAVHAQDAQHVLLVGGEPAERTHPRRRAGRCGIGVPTHQRRDRRRPRTSGGGVVGQSERHQQGAEVGVPEPELAELVGVLGDLLCWVVSATDEDLLGGEHHLDGVAERVDVEAVVVEESQEVYRGEIAR